MFDINKAISDQPINDGSITINTGGDTISTSSIEGNIVPNTLLLQTPIVNTPAYTATTINNLWQNGLSPYIRSKLNPVPTPVPVNKYWWSTYNNLQNICVSSGELVLGGQKIAEIGSGNYGLNWSIGIEPRNTFTIMSDGISYCALNTYSIVNPIASTGIRAVVEYYQGPANQLNWYLSRPEQYVFWPYTAADVKYIAFSVAYFPVDYNNCTWIEAYGSTENVNTNQWFYYKRDFKCSGCPSQGADVYCIVSGEGLINRVEVIDSGNLQNSSISIRHFYRPPIRPWYTVYDGLSSMSVSGEQAIISGDIIGIAGSGFADPLAPTGLATCKFWVGLEGPDYVGLSAKALNLSTSFAVSNSGTRWESGVAPTSYSPFTSTDLSFITGQFTAPVSGTWFNWIGTSGQTDNDYYKYYLVSSGTGVNTNLYHTYKPRWHNDYSPFLGMNNNFSAIDSRVIHTGISSESGYIVIVQNNYTYVE